MQDIKIEHVTKVDLTIIGAGPGGLSAALYAKRAGLNFEIVEKLMPGGQIINTEIVENYPGFKESISGYELALELVEHCEKFGIKVRDYFPIDSIEHLTGDRSSDKNKSYRFKCSGDSGIIWTNAVIMATGAYPDRLNVEGEKEFIGRGISFCATCDGALYKDKEVAVVGGGDTALDEAIFLTRFVKKVYIIHRRNELRAVQILRDRAFKNEKIEFLWSSVIEKFTGSDKLEEVLVRNIKDDKTYKLKVDAVFEYVGWKPNSGLVKDLVRLDERGFIITNSQMEASLPGLFAIGDVRNTPLRQVITAVADGAIAAMYADRFLYSIGHQ
ncbi:MAG: thioredoxin-disulfide reductase [Actinobacteria bacterium RBG_19FT_COMBO_36_27]|nr:MAG: thioredoxin-disulfide reductase [Actinobacteria bacterium RBG_19FT_COMBO_36_27]